jgi:hypothetical protein
MQSYKLVRNPSVLLLGIPRAYRAAPHVPQRHVPSSTESPACAWPSACRTARRSSLDAKGGLVNPGRSTQLLNAFTTGATESQKKCSSVSDFPACCVVRVAGALWCVVTFWTLTNGQSMRQFPMPVKLLRAEYPSIPDLYRKYCGKSMCQFPTSAHPTDPSETPRIRFIYLHIPHINTCDTTTHHNAPATRTTQHAGKSLTLEHFFWLLFF